MKKLLMLFWIPAVLAGQILELNPVDFDWIAPRGQHKQNSFQVNDGGIAFKFPEVGEGGAWFVGQPRQEVMLTGKKFLNFSARSNDGQTHLIYFYIRRELQANDQASYYTMVEITPKWKTFNLKLERSSRTNAGKGYFVYTKGTKNCDIDLRKGGRLLTLQPVVKEAADISFKDFNLSEEPLADNPKAAAMAGEILAHKKVQPYQFKEVIKADAVKAAGFRIVARDSEKFAAAELSKYLEKATGVKFPVVAATGEKNIVLAVKPGEPEDAFRAELTDGKNLKITGNSPRALTYAVYDFLEKAAGVRWFAPFDYGEVVPLNPELAFPLFKDESAPAMSYRCPHYCSYTRLGGAEKHAYDVADWAYKNRYNVELERLKNRDKIKEFYAERGGCIWLMEHAGHNFHKLIPPKKYFEDHPEFFCYDRATGKWKADYAQLCTTNPGLIKEFGKVADEYFARNPEQQFFPLFQEDGARLWCQCPPCLALNPSGSNLAKATENNVNLANSVLREIRKNHPDKSVYTYAYGITASPPEKVPPLPGVRIMYCWYSDGNPALMPWNARAFADLDEWSRLTDGNVVVYSYHYLNPRYAFNNEHVLTNMFRAFDLLKIQGSNQESRESWGGVDAYLLYLGGRLPWNPWYDEEALKEDYFNRFYGAGGPAIRAFHDLLSARLSDKSNWPRMGLSQYGCIVEADLKKMAEYLETARQAVKDDPRAAKAVAAQAGYLKYLSAFSAAMAAGDRFFRAPDPEKYQSAMTAIKELKEVTKALWPDRIVSFYEQRTYEAWERSLKAAHEENLARSGILKDYDIVKILNPWRFKTDPEARGDREQWVAADFDDSAWKQLNSGKFWEDQGVSDYDGTAWYRMAVAIPSGQAAALYFGGADERAWVYLDGKYIGGHHEGDVGKLWNEPFLIDIPEGTTPGTHQLSVKVIDSAGKGGLWKDVLLLQKKGSLPK